MKKVEIRRGSSWFAADDITITRQNPPTTQTTTTTTTTTIRPALTVPEALRIGNAMMRAGLLRHVVDDHLLENRKLFYRFLADDTANGTHSGSSASLSTSAAAAAAAAAAGGFQEDQSVSSGASGGGGGGGHTSSHSNNNRPASRAPP